MNNSQPPLETNVGKHTILLDLRYQVVSPEVDNNDAKTQIREAEIIVYYRNLSGDRGKYTIKNYLPYFYVQIDYEALQVLIKENIALADWFTEWEEVTRYLYERGKQVKILKITGLRPWETPKIRQIFTNANFKVFEADIPFVHRYMIDNNLYGLQEFQILKDKLYRVEESNYTNFKVMSFDIEIDVDFDPEYPSESLSSIIETAKKRITAISCCWGIDQNVSEGDVFVLEADDDDSERKLIKEFWNFVWTKVDPDVVTTYNGDNFDFPYMLKRMDTLGISTKLVSPHNDSEPIRPAYGRGWSIPGVLVFDLFKRTKWLYTHDGRKSLDSVSQSVLNKPKSQLTMSHGQMWRTGLISKEIRDQFYDYALNDAKLTFELFFGLGLSEWLEVIKITGSPPREAMYYTQRQAGEFLLFRVMFEKGVLIPPTPGAAGKKERDKKRKSAEGGFVFEPTTSIATGVLIADFSSMYPSLMISHNIGSESFQGTKFEFKERFKSQPMTTMALMQQKLLDERFTVKDKLKQENLDPETHAQLNRYSWALKIVANSTIGSYNYTGSRLYNTNISGSVTGLGRTYLQELAQLAKSYNPGNDTIYGDTDSIFLTLSISDQIEKLWNLPAEDSKNLERYLPEVGNLLRYLQNNLPNQMRLELQDVAYRILFHKGAKKRYSYVSIITKKVTIIGFEAIRHDWSPFARDTQKHTINLVLTSGDLKVSKQNLISYLQEKIKQPDEILKNEFVKLGPIRRPPSKYKSPTPALGAFLEYCRLNNLDAEREWKTYDYFPYLIVKGSEPLYQRSRPSENVVFEDIDVNYYLQEAISAANRFNLNLTIDEILYDNLSKYFP